ncbi:hypothetical protein XELAEV_18035090mg [Xenopus laevis]|uniref:Uncharacterized protein n=1 Tax=Xenopus laevis TaxID=8355 RepID=A0A974HBS7_XENLA|nr:hypothetical protein XELAEV_18035090mg [Xenopus laevis]
MNHGCDAVTAQAPSYTIDDVAVADDEKRPLLLQPTLIRCSLHCFFRGQGCRFHLQCSRTFSSGGGLGVEEKEVCALLPLPPQPDPLTGMMDDCTRFSFHSPKASLSRLTGG